MLLQQTFFNRCRRGKKKKDTESERERERERESRASLVFISSSLLSYSLDLCLSSLCPYLCFSFFSLSLSLALSTSFSGAKRASAREMGGCSSKGNDHRPPQQDTAGGASTGETRSEKEEPSSTKKTNALPFEKKQIFPSCPTSTRGAQRNPRRGSRTRAQDALGAPRQARAAGRLGESV